MSDVEELISRYVNEGLQHRARMQAKLFTLFTETTGYRPDDLCLVEQQIKKGIHEYTSIYYFDWKHRHQTMEPQSSLQSQLKEAEEKLKIAVEVLERARRVTPLSLLMDGWVHGKNCPCYVCEALEKLSKDV